MGVTTVDITLHIESASVCSLGRLGAPLELCVRACMVDRLPTERTAARPCAGEEVKSILGAQAARMDGEARSIARQSLPADCIKGTCFALRAHAIPNLATLKREVFGPVLHVIRWQASELDQVIDAINASGCGFTLGTRSRIDETVERISKRVRVGHWYVNRNQIGAVVGVQPFGGEGRSGTGPKAGGPLYLLRFTTERTRTTSTTAAGGNATLLA